MPYIITGSGNAPAAASFRRNTAKEALAKVQPPWQKAKKSKLGHYRRARRVGNDPGRGRSRDFTGRYRQIWRSRRCRRRYPQHRRRLRSPPQWRLGTQL